MGFEEQTDEICDLCKETNDALRNLYSNFAIKVIAVYCVRLLCDVRSPEDISTPSRSLGSSEKT